VLECAIVYILLFTCLFNIKNAKYCLSKAQLYDVLSVGTALSTYDHRSTGINVS